MRIHQILTESQQQELQQLQEGPLGSLVKAAGKGVGNVIGGVARTAGAVKGAVKGAVQRAKDSFASGERGAYDTLAGKPSGDAATTAQPAAAGGQASGAAPTADPAKKPGVLGKIGQAVKDFKAGYDGNTDAGADAQKSAAAAPVSTNAATTAEPSGSAAPGTTDGDQQPAGKAAAVTQPTAPSQDKTAANDTQYAQTQKALSKLSPEQQKEIYAALIADPKVKAVLDKPPVTKKKPAAKAAATPPNTMANAPVSAANKAKAGNPNMAAPVAKKAVAPTATTTNVPQTTLTNKGFGQMVGQLAGGQKK